MVDVIIIPIITITIDIFLSPAKNPDPSRIIIDGEELLAKQWPRITEKKIHIYKITSSKTHTHNFKLQTKQLLMYRYTTLFRFPPQWRLFLSPNVHLTGISFGWFLFSTNFFSFFTHVSCNTFFHSVNSPFLWNKVKKSKNIRELNHPNKFKREKL